MADDATQIKLGVPTVFGACGDTHFGSKYERLDVINALYDQYEKSMYLTHVFHTGNWIEGESRFNKNDINIAGIENQFDYFFINYPRRPGITTYFIGGDDHEGWYTRFNGVNLAVFWTAKQVEHNRPDMVYLGYQQADVEYQGITIRIVHPGGGSHQAISGQAQKLVDVWSPGDYVDVLLVGHYHKAHFLPQYKTVTVIQTGSAQDITPFMNKMKIVGHIGGWIVSMFPMSVSDDSTIKSVGYSTQAQYFPFQPNRWEYKATVDRRFLG